MYNSLDLALYKTFDCHISPRLSVWMRDNNKVYPVFLFYQIPSTIHHVQ